MTRRLSFPYRCEQRGIPPRPAPRQSKHRAARQAQIRALMSAQAVAS